MEWVCVNERTLAPVNWNRLFWASPYDIGSPEPTASAPQLSSPAALWLYKQAGKSLLGEERDKTISSCFFKIMNVHHIWKIPMKNLIRENTKSKNDKSGNQDEGSLSEGQRSKVQWDVWKWVRRPVNGRLPEARHLRARSWRFMHSWPFDSVLRSNLWETKWRFVLLICFPWHRYGLLLPLTYFGLRNKRNQCSKGILPELLSALFSQ